MNPHSKSTTSTSRRELAHEEQTLHKRANDIIQFFLDLLRMIGGDLKTSKSASFVLCNIWSGGKSSLVRKHEIHPERILVHPYPGVNTVVPRKERDKLHHALGWMMTIYRISTAQHKALFDKARVFTTAIHGSK
jgi:hypothetical protein